MNDEDLRDFFAAFAMISKAWMPPSLEDHAKNCYAIADAMIAERNRVPEEGIASVVKKRRKPTHKEA
jgi:hypothetical protein